MKANNYIYLFLSVIAFTLSMYAYNSARIFTPLFVLGLIAINRDILFKSINISKIIGFVSAVLVGIILMMPILSTITKPEVVQRAKYISIFYDKGITAKLFDGIRSDEGQQVRLTQFFHNKVIYYGMDIARRYLSHFDPNFLFITGDKFEIFKMEGLGFLPLLSLPFMLVGLYSLTNEYESKVKKTIAAWIFISPLASSLTIFTPSTSRAANLIIPLCIISAIGFKYIVEKFEAYKYKFVFTFSVVAMFNVAYIYNQYFIITPKYVAEKWNDGIKDTVEVVSQFQNDYEKIIVSSSQAPSYIFYLWYQKYDPARYQQEANVDNSPDEHGLNFVKSYGKFEFTKSIKEVQKTNDINNKVFFVGFKDELVTPEISIESRNKIKVAEIKF